MDDSAAPSSATYRIETGAVEGRVAAVVDGHTVAESTGVVRMLETHLPPVLYFPRSAVDPSVLRRGDKRTFCPFRGSATHWSLRLPSRTIDDAAWSYERPLEISRSIAGYIAFYAGVVENWIAEPGVLDTPSVQDLITELPLVEWVLREAWFAASTIELTERLGQTIVDVGLPLLQLNVGIWTLHPQLAGTTYTWVRDGKGVRVSHTPRGAPQAEAYLKSPEHFVSEGLGGVRQRLDVEDPEFHFPIMAELRAAGGTDYAAMPLPYLGWAGSHADADLGSSKRILGRRSGTGIRIHPHAEPPLRGPHAARQTPRFCWTSTSARAPANRC